MLMPRATTSPLTSAAQQIMGGIQSRKAQERQQMLNKIMGNALLGDAQAMEQLAQADPNAFMKIQQQQANVAAAQQKAMGGGVKPETRAKANTMLKDLLSNVALLPEDQRAQALVDAKVEFDNVYGGLGVEFPSEIGEREQRLFARINEQNQAASEKIVDDTKKGQGEKYRTEFNKLATDFNAVNSHLDTINRLLDGDRVSGVDAQAAIMSFYKALDPSSVVSQSEAGMVVQSQSIPDQLVSGFNRLLSGEGFDENLRRDLKNTANTISAQRKDKLFNAVKPTVEIANREGINKASFMGDSFSNMYDQWSLGGETTQAPSMTTTETVETTRQLSPAEQITQQSQQAEEAPVEVVQEAVVIQAHPTYGDITEADIQETMRAMNMTREQVMQRLEAQ